MKAKRQLGLKLHEHRHGGARKGAGRPRKAGRRRGAHRRRARFSSARALQVTIRVLGFQSLRKRKRYGVVHEVFCKTRRPGFRICHYSVQDDHIHLIVEASSRAKMTSGMRSVNIRIGQGINRAFGRRSGKVIADRYHEGSLLTPKQIRNTLAYVINNVRKHVWQQMRDTCLRDWLDPCSSARFFDGWRGGKDPIPIGPDDPVQKPRTPLLNKLWRRHRLLDINAIPGPRQAFADVSGRRDGVSLKTGGHGRTRAGGRTR